MRQTISFGRREDGASTVEFAILLPLLLLILFGTIQFGIAFDRKQGLHAAAREGARLASIGADFREIEDRVRESQSLFESEDVLVRTNPATNPPCSKVGDTVEVVVEVSPSEKYAITVPMLGEHQITYRANGSFRCERNGVSR